MKSVPPFDLILNSIGNGFICISIGFIIADNLSVDVLKISLPYMLLMAAVYLLTTIPDIHSDKKSGIETTGVLLGKALTMVFALIFLISSMIAGLVLFDILLVLLAIPGLALLMKSFSDPSEKNIRSTFIGIASIFTVAAGLIFPYYLLFLFITIVFLRRYYRSRFSKSYP
jgi:1,4-dihydroxy-2-naphthoate octaprenyltransferase